MRIKFFLLASLLIPAVSAVAAAESKPSVESVYSFGPDLPPGNVTITPQGRVIMSLHQFYGSNLRVVEIAKDGSTSPFPSPEWANAPKEGAAVGLHNVLGVRSDANGVVWLLDQIPKEGTDGALVGWDTVANRVSQVLRLAPPAVVAQSFFNDLAIDTKHQAIFITDSASGADAALIVVDLKSGSARRVLQGHRSTTPEKIALSIDGRKLLLDGKELRVGADPITIDPQFEWLYFGPMSGNSLYRVRTADLVDPLLAPGALAAKVERYGDKPICDGITIDGSGTVYVSDLAHNGIGVISPERTYRLLFQDDQMLRWVNGMAVGPDGYVYATVNQLHLSPPLNRGKNEAEPPFAIVRFKPLAERSAAQ